MSKYQVLCCHDLQQSILRQEAKLLYTKKIARGLVSMFRAYGFLDTSAISSLNPASRFETSATMEFLEFYKDHEPLHRSTREG